MFKIIYNNEAYISLDIFITYLKDYYKRIYFDTGIVDECQIISHYIEKTDNLFDEVVNKIEHSINKGYLGEIIETNSLYELSKLIIQVRSYNIKVIIRKKKTTIFIENIFMK